jgi:DNA ligase (NAD+)
MYYVKSESLVSDFEFDMLLKELEALEAKFPELVDANSPSKRVGGAVVKNFETVTHRFPMLSLSNSYSKEEIIEWEERIKKTIEQDIEYVCELKYDGVAIGIRYVNGVFHSAVTRGDGTQGELVSSTSFLPPILTPIVTLVFPGLVFALFFVLVEQEEVA